jgi:AraC-like DNA-binding protein
VYEGETHLVNDQGVVDPTPATPIFVAGPQHHPTVTWSAGHGYSLTVGFYPDAWTMLTGINAGKLIDSLEPLDQIALGEFSQIFHAVRECDSFQKGFESLQDQIDPIWQKTRPWPKAAAPQQLKDWVQALVERAAHWSTGTSERQMQRRIKSWTGFTLRELKVYTQAESLFALGRTAPPDLDLAKAAADAGYADQSHMGRAIRTITGESPATLSQLLQSDTRHWVYRLIDSRLQTPSAKDPKETIPPKDRRRRR